MDEWHGTNAFTRDGDRVFRTYLVNSRGDEAMGSTWSYLDITALGRQEAWEDSPRATPRPRPTSGGTITTRTQLADDTTDPHVCPPGLPFGVDVHETTFRVNVRWVTPLGEETASTS